MRLITKARPPGEVAQTEKAATTNLSAPTSAREAFNQLDKSRVRAALATEQQRICAFCMERIQPDLRDDDGRIVMKIAHRQPIAIDPSAALTWSNLLGSCDGGERSGGRRRTCDLAQGDAPLSVDPTQSGSIAKLRYEYRDARQGLFITSDDPQLRTDVEGTLRLNTGELPSNRLSAWRGFLEATKRRFPKEYGKPARQKWLEERRTAAGAALDPYWGMLEAMVR